MDGGITAADGAVRPAAFDARLFGVPAGADFGHQDAPGNGEAGVSDQGGEELYGFDVDPAALHEAVPNQIGHNPPGGVRGNGEPDAH